MNMKLELEPGNQKLVLYLIYFNISRMWWKLINRKTFRNGFYETYDAF